MVVLGTDTHKRSHTVVAVDEAGTEVAALTVAATGEGHLRLVKWAAQWPKRRWAIEDCRALSRRLEADLLAAGEQVVRVPPKLMPVPVVPLVPGKSDPIDAWAVARAALREPGLPTARLDGPDREIRLLVDYRESLVVRVFGDITLAEDAVQDAFVVASDRWRRGRIPPNPAGWIVTTARNRAIDDLRRSARGRELHGQLGAVASISHGPGVEDWGEDGPVGDDQLRLIFTCCHPALRTEHQVALTLQLLGGLSVDEVARSFLVSESAMAKRLVPAKYKIKAANIPFRMPTDDDLPVRLRSVLSVVYLIYNTGVDNPERASLQSDAIRLARALAGLMPDEPEAAGLLALMLLSESRVPARRAEGVLVLLRDQDRTK